ncbi:transcriptional regulator [Pelagibacterium luteolum]|uniref:Predicted transcriptional regulator n=1 Tax=Pelagibacterium luteolum TaxID=440168 RepID=A0A1G7TF46_9HYPH|nr:transcriptional regulator [Pelagibacterium luteolum]SDG33987.1 Predicted transcriptional regulator [Pelagibacterium luteolum]
MTTLTVRLGTLDEARARLLDAGRRALDGKANTATPTLNFASYEDMHRVLAPARLAIVKVLAGQGTLSIREVARRVDRDVQAVHRDVTTLITAGVIDRSEKGISFPYANIHFEFDVTAAA